MFSGQEIRQDIYFYLLRVKSNFFYLITFISPSLPFEKNKFFVEMRVIEVKLRMASARCMSDCTIVSLTKAEYEKRLNSN